MTVQICHLAGAGGYDSATDEALAVFAEAIGRHDPRTRNVYFDASGITIPGVWEENANLIVKRMRQIGLNRFLYGSDALVAGNSVREALERWRQLPLTKEEFRAIETNVSPYLRSLPQ